MKYFNLLLIFLFEQELALKAKGLISNNRSSDYIKLIKDISDKKITLNQFDKPTSISFEDLNIDIEGCGDFFNVNNEKTRKLKLISQLMLDKNSNIHDAFKEYNSVVNENDFNFTFYKLYTFIIINYYKLELQNEI